MLPAARFEEDCDAEEEVLATSGSLDGSGVAHAPDPQLWQLCRNFVLDVCTNVHLSELDVRFHEETCTLMLAAKSIYADGALTFELWAQLRLDQLHKDPAQTLAHGPVSGPGTRIFCVQYDVKGNVPTALGDELAWHARHLLATFATLVNNLPGIKPNLTARVSTSRRSGAIQVTHHSELRAPLSFARYATSFLLGLVSVSVNRPCSDGVLPVIRAVSACGGGTDAKLRAGQASAQASLDDVLRAGHEAVAKGRITEDGAVMQYRVMEGFTWAANLWMRTVLCTDRFPGTRDHLLRIWGTDPAPFLHETPPDALHQDVHHRLRQGLHRRLHQRSRQGPCQGLSNTRAEAPYAKHSPEAPYAKHSPEAPYAKHSPEAPYAKHSPEAPYAKHGPKALYAKHGPKAFYARSGSEASYAKHGPKAHYARSRSDGVYTGRAASPVSSIPLTAES